MYRAIGDESSWRDGVFSHAAPFQDYQASTKQFEEGSLGAWARPATRSEMARNARSQKRPPMRPQMRGFGSSFRDGSLGTYAYRAGSLGDDPVATPSTSLPSLPSITPTTINVGPNGLTVVPTPPPPVPYFQRPAVQIAAAGGLAVILYLCLRKH